MPDFFRTNATGTDAFIRGAARLMWAGTTIAMPTKITDVIDTTAYNAASGWNDLGATKAGIQISVNNTEETFDVDQIIGDIDTRPVSWQYAVQTQLAEMTLPRLAFLWEGSAVTTDAGVTPNELEVGFGMPVIYTQRRLAVLFQRSDGKIRGFFFRKAVRSPQDSNVNFNKTGEQISVPARFTCLPDLSITDIYKRVFIIRDQV
jgi:hypothetical protein